MSREQKIYEFDEFQLDVDDKTLWHGLKKISLPLKALEMLTLLLENRGRIVTKEEILETLWQDTFVDENNLAVIVSALRKVFGERKNENRYIQTIPRRGYRFVAEAKETNGNLILEKHTVTEITLEKAEATKNYLPELGIRWQFIALILLGVLFVASVGWWWGFSREKGLSSAPIPVRNIKSIAVLPLKNLNENEQNNTLKIALTDNLISRLANLKRFAVRSFSAVEKFEASGKDAIKFAEDLKVDAVLEGTIQQSEGRLRVNVRLFDVRDGVQIWIDSFDEKESDIFRLQDLISERISKSLVSNLNAEEKEILAKRPTENVDAYMYYLKGREEWNKRGPKNPIFYFQKAIELDNNFALAYVGLADAQAMSPEPSFAEETLRKAIALDNTLAEPHATLGFIRMFHYFDWQEAERELKKSIELNPNYATAHHWLGVYYSLHRRLDEAKAEMLKAHELDPTSPIILTDLGQLFYFSHEYDRAVEFCNKSLELDPESVWNYGHLMNIYSKQGKEFHSRS